MAKFVFKLQSLLNVKIQMEDSLKNELGKAIRALEHEKDILRAIESEKEECMNSMRLKPGRGIVVEKLREYNAYLSLLKQKIEFQKENINKAQLNADNYREQLIKVSTEKKMLEKLKEKEYTKYLEANLKEEQKLNDEIVSFNHRSI